MNNIENSIRHLQRNIKLRSYDITRHVSYVKDYLICKGRSVGTVRYHEYKREIERCKEEIEQMSKQQKIEKKMLAMMFSLNRMQYSKNNTVKSTCEYLDNL